MNLWEKQQRLDSVFDLMREPCGSASYLLRDETGCQPVGLERQAGARCPAFRKRFSRAWGGCGFSRISFSEPRGRYPTLRKEFSSP
jgi:hypothetical protein